MDVQPSLSFKNKEGKLVAWLIILIGKRALL